MPMPISPFPHSSTAHCSVGGGSIVRAASRCPFSYFLISTFSHLHTAQWCQPRGLGYRRRQPVLISLRMPISPFPHFCISPFPHCSVGARCVDGATDAANRCPFFSISSITHSPISLLSGCWPHGRGHRRCQPVLISLPMPISTFPHFFMSTFPHFHTAQWVPAAWTGPPTPPTC